jgi:hypothetical protein
MSLLSGGCGGGCAVVAGAGGAGSLFCCIFLPVWPADAAVSCLRRGLSEAVYTRQETPHSSGPPAPWAPVLSFLIKGTHYIVDVEILKRALRELVEKEPAFFRDLMLDALRSDGGAAEALLELITKHPEARLKLAQVVARSIAVPLNVVAKAEEPWPRM